MSVAVLIKSCRKNRERRDACRETWLHDLKWPYKFLVGADGGDRSAVIVGDEPDVLIVEARDGYREIAPKLQLGIGFMSKGLTNLFVCDDDTYVAVKRLEESKPRGAYVGWLREQGYVQGSAIWYSQRAMQAIVDSREMEQTDVMDDVHVGPVLARYGIFGTDDRRYYPGPEPMRISSVNNYITTHKCFPDTMRWIHDDWKKNQ